MAFFRLCRAKMALLNEPVKMESRPLAIPSTTFISSKLLASSRPNAYLIFNGVIPNGS